MKRSGVIACAVLAMGVGLGLWAWPPAQVRADSKDLKFYPKDMSQPDLYKEMRQISKDLGVKCAFCHVMTPRKQFEKDTKHKEIALKMLVLTKEINEDLTKIFGEGKAKKVTCFTCHRGEEHPASAPEDDDDDD